MRIVFWQNQMSFHQSAHIRALADTYGCDVTWVVGEKTTPARAAMGWPVADPAPVRVVVAPDEREVQQLAEHAPADSVHVFSGIRAYSVVRNGLAACLPTAAALGVLAERGAGHGLGGLARRARWRLGWVRLRSRISFLLTIGSGACQWYARCGVPPERIFPYGYFMERPAPATSPRPQQTTVRIAYVGGLVHGKGVDILVSALARLRTRNWRATIIGEGPLRTTIEGLVRRLGVGSHVAFTGVLPHAGAMAALAQHDLLVLPSRRKDGWGAVVSEALMRGVPAICTDQCGAADLLREPWRGEVVRAGSVRSLSDALERWIARGPGTLQESQRMRAWSSCIEGESAAAYLLDVVNCALGGGPRPTPPWHQV